MMGLDDEHGSAAMDDPRVRMAGERTLLAWIRTSLALMGFGFVVARFGLFLRELASVAGTPTKLHVGWSPWIGNALILLAVVVTVLASVEHYRLLQRIDQQRAYQPPQWSLALVTAGLLVLAGLGLAAYLAAVTG